MSPSWRPVAFPLILPWRPEFWTLPLFFPDLAVGVLWHWPAGLPYKGRELPPQAVAGGREFKRYAPGELKQWQAFEEYSRSREEVADIVRALKGEPAEPDLAAGPWNEKEAINLAWQLEVLEADQEAHLAQIDRGDEWLAEILSVEPLEDSERLPGLPGVQEIVDPWTARLRYFLWRREMETVLGPLSAPLLLGRTSQGIFASLREITGQIGPPLVRFKLPGCRSEDEYRAVDKVSSGSGWQQEFQELLGDCLSAADQGAGMERAARELSRWLEKTLLRQWPEVPPWTWDLEIWGRDPEAGPGGEPLLAWGGLGKGVVAG